MKVHVDDFLIWVKLSERNIRTLHHKLDEPDSQRTLIRRNEDGRRLIVQVERDADHYEDREPGEVHPREEAKLKAEAA